MFDFGNLLDLGQAYMGYKTAKNTAKKNYGDKYAQQGLKDASRLSAALANPNDKLYKEYEAQELDGILQDYQLGLQDLINQNRRLSGMGRTPLFDTERGGEQVYRAMLLGRGKAGQQARDQATARLKTGYDAATGIASRGASASGNERERMALDQSANYGLYSGLSDALAPYFRNTGSKLGQNITWNSDRWGS